MVLNADFVTENWNYWPPRFSIPVRNEYTSLHDRKDKYLHWKIYQNRVKEEKVVEEKRYSDFIKAPKVMTKSSKLISNTL